MFPNATQFVTWKDIWYVRCFVSCITRVCGAKWSWIAVCENIVSDSKPVSVGWFVCFILHWEESQWLSFFCSSSELGYNRDLIEGIRAVQVNLEVIQPNIKHNPNIQPVNKPHQSSLSSTLVINKYSLLFIGLGMKNNGKRWGGNLHSLLNWNSTVPPALVFSRHPEYCENIFPK